MRRACLAVLPVLILALLEPGPALALEGWIMRAADATGVAPPESAGVNYPRPLPGYAGTRLIGGLVREGDEACYTAAVTAGNAGETVTLTLSHPNLESTLSEPRIGGLQRVAAVTRAQPETLDGGDTIVTYRLTADAPPRAGVVVCMPLPREIVTSRQGQAGGQWAFRAHWTAGSSPAGMMVDVGVIAQPAPRPPAFTCPEWWQLDRVAGDWDISHGTGVHFYMRHPANTVPAPGIPADMYYNFRTIFPNSPAYWALRRAGGFWIKEPCPGNDLPRQELRILANKPAPGGGTLFELELDGSRTANLRQLR